jgi:hypothetical protein
MADLTDAFTLQDPGFTAADTVATRWLTFASDSLEQDFMRFRGRGRDAATAFLLVGSAVAAVFKLLVTPLTPLMTIFLLIGLAFSILGIPVYIAVVVCPRQSAVDSAARQVVLARRHELFMLTFIAGIIMPGMGEWMLKYRDCRSNASHNELCEMAFMGNSMGAIGLFHFLARPCLPSLIAPDASVSAFTLIMMGVFSGSASALDFFFVAIFLAVTAAVFMCDSYVRERAERRNFVEHATLLTAGLELERLSEGTRAVVAAAMPTELTQLGSAAPRDHRSDDATVGVADIADFASWSCRLLIKDVVTALHELMLLVDVGATLHDVVNVMSYGDNCVVCAGLITACDNHAERVANFGRWMLHSPDSLSFRVRFSMSSGTVMGGLVGDTCKRFIVAGPAVAAAQAALADGPLGEVAAAGDARAPVYAAVPSEQSKGGTELSGAATSSSSEASTFSNMWLSFDDDEMQQLFQSFEARNFQESKKLLSAIPVAVFALHLAIILLELAREDERRSSSDPLPFVGFAAAIALSAGVAAMRRHASAPFALDVLLTAAAFLLGAVATGLSGSPLFHGLRMLMLLGIPNTLPRLSLVAQTAVVVATVGLPCLVFDYILTGQFSLIPNFLATMALVVGAKYYAKRVTCQHYVASAKALLAVTAARDETQRFADLLAGLLPPHAVQLVPRLSKSWNTGDEARARKRWEGVSVLQVQLSATLLHDVSTLAAAWSTVASAVTAIPSQLLELVETCGDTFLIAGPFAENGSAEACRATAGEVLLLLGVLKRRTAPYCRFTAVASHGSAYGALVGYSGLAFRFFGPAVRENNAILAAAPITTGAAVAFATAGFRQQHANFGVAARPPRVGEQSKLTFAMSLAVAAESMQQDTHAAVSMATAEFGAAMNWRMRGAGVSRVSAIRMAVTEEPCSTL